MIPGLELRDDASVAVIVDESSGRTVVRATARYIGMAVGNLVTIVDPEVVVLGEQAVALGAARAAMCGR